MTNNILELIGHLIKLSMILLGIYEMIHSHWLEGNAKDFEFITGCLMILLARREAQ